MRPKVLVVDDESEVRRVIRRALEDVDCDVIECADGADAAMLIEAERPAVALLDIHMPRLDGLAVADELRSKHPEVAIVVVSGDATRSRIRCALGRGASDFLAKPLDLKDLKDTVTELLLPAGPDSPGS